MAAYWDTEWDDEEKLKNKSAIDLYKIFLAAGTDAVKQDKVKSAMKTKFEDVNSFAEANPYELI